MISARADVEERKQEARILLSLISEMSSRPESIVRTAILKSAHMIMLYNAIESSANSVMERIHEVVGKEKFSDLRPEIRKLWAEYFFQRQSEKLRLHNLEATVRGDAKFPRLSEFLDHINLFSGNLDGRAINELLAKYGIGSLATADRAKLLDIKSKRNKIAHGEEMFKEACRNYTLAEMESYQAACFNALESVLDLADAYISQKRYKAAPLGITSAS